MPGNLMQYLELSRRRPGFARLVFRPCQAPLYCGKHCMPTPLSSFLLSSSTQTEEGHVSTLPRARTRPTLTLSLPLLLACLLGVWVKGPQTPHPALSRYA